MNITSRQIVYLVLAVAGLCLTWYFFLRWVAGSGAELDPLVFLRDVYQNDASIAFANDLLVGCVVFIVFSFVESRRLGMRHWWIWPLLTLSTALAFAFPLFLFLRDRRLHAPGG